MKRIRSIKDNRLRASLGTRPELGTVRIKVILREYTQQISDVVIEVEVEELKSELHAASVVSSLLEVNKVSDFFKVGLSTS